MGVGISLYEEHNADNPMKKHIEIVHGQRHYKSNRSCGQKNVFYTDSSEFRTAMKKGYFKCWRCDEKMKFRKQRYNRVVLWLDEEKK